VLHTITAQFCLWSYYSAIWLPFWLFFQTFVPMIGNNMRQVQPETVIFLPVYKISNLKITPPKTPNSGQSSYPLPNFVSFLFRLEFRFRSRERVSCLEVGTMYGLYCIRTAVSVCIKDKEIMRSKLKLLTPDSLRIRYQTLFHFYFD
jgi:hypothetical protein